MIIASFWIINLSYYRVQNVNMVRTVVTKRAWSIFTNVDRSALRKKNMVKLKMCWISPFPLVRLMFCKSSNYGNLYNLVPYLFIRIYSIFMYSMYKCFCSLWWICKYLFFFWTLIISFSIYYYYYLNKGKIIKNWKLYKHSFFDDHEVLPQIILNSWHYLLLYN